jgi:hypothetical protein
MDTDVVNAEVIIAVDHTKLGHICLTLDQDDTLVTDLDPAVEDRPHSAYECDASGWQPRNFSIVKLRARSVRERAETTLYWP